MDLYPDWVSWAHDRQFLPESFHTRDGFKSLLTALNHPVEDSYGSLEFFALAVGLALRDSTLLVSDDRDSLSEVLAKSPLGQKHLDRLMKSCHPKVDRRHDDKSVFLPALTVRR